MSKILPAALLLAGSIMVPANPASAQQSSGTPAAASQNASSLFVVIYRPGPAWQAGRPMSEQGLLPHGRYYRGLLDGGRLFAGGGFVGSDGGMAILRAADLAAAQAIVAADPAVTSRIFVAELEEWRPRFRVEEPLPSPPGPN
jgi:uncharacterized protein YciI